MLFNILSYVSNQLLGKGNTVAAVDELYLFLTNMTAIEYIRNGIKKGYEANGMDTSYLRAALERAVYHAQHQEQEEDEDLDEDFEETDDFQMTFE